MRSFARVRRGLAPVHPGANAGRVGVRRAGRRIRRLPRLYDPLRVLVFAAIWGARLDLDVAVGRIFNWLEKTITAIDFYTILLFFWEYKGWAIAPEERDWKYRLSIYYAKPQDSGTFTCATPRGITNSITLHVAGKLFAISSLIFRMRSALRGRALWNMALFLITHHQSRLS